MPSFRALPPSLRPVARTKGTRPDAKSIHVPVARAMVDCGIYVDGQRPPGKYTHAAALNKVHELEREGKDAFVWIGLHEPDEHQMQAVADVFCLHELAVEDAVHAHQRPKLERYDKTLFLVLKTVNYVEHVSDGQRPRDRRDRRDHDLRRPRLRGHGSPRRARRAGRGAQAARRLAGDPQARPVRDHARDRRSRRGQLPRHHRSDRDRHRRDGRGHLLAADADQHRVHLPAQAGGRRAAAGRSRR